MKTKTYLTINELIDYIKSKGIVVSNEEETKEILKQNNYYVIMGYKDLFIKDNKYKDNVSFDNIYSLYKFDRELKMLFLNTLLDVENIIKNAIVNQFCSTYGFKEDNYLNKDNYNMTHTYLPKIMGIFKQQIEEKKKNNVAVEYYINTYNFVPFWIISKVLSFGLIKDLYNIMKKTDERVIKDSVCHFKDTKIKHLYTQLQLMVHKRNNTAHDEIFFNDIDRKLLIHKTEEHKKFNLSNNRSGLNDTLGLLICIKIYYLKKIITS